jgi:hypothetical protein
VILPLLTCASRPRVDVSNGTVNRPTATTPRVRVWKPRPQPSIEGRVAAFVSIWALQLCQRLYARHTIMNSLVPFTILRVRNIGANGRG